MLHHLFVSAGRVKKNAFDIDIAEFDHGFFRVLMFFWSFFAFPPPISLDFWGHWYFSLALTSYGMISGTETSAASMCVIRYPRPVHEYKMFCRSFN